MFTPLDQIKRWDSIRQSPSQIDTSKKNLKNLKCKIQIVVIAFCQWIVKGNTALQNWLRCGNHRRYNRKSQWKCPLCWHNPNVLAQILLILSLCFLPLMWGQQWLLLKTVINNQTYEYEKIPFSRCQYTCHHLFQAYYCIQTEPWAWQTDLGMYLCEIVSSYNAKGRVPPCWDEKKSKSLGIIYSKWWNPLKLNTYPDPTNTDVTLSI